MTVNRPSDLNVSYEIGSPVTDSTASAIRQRRDAAWSGDQPVSCLGGHLVTGKLVEYADGLFVANCQTCGERIKIERIPGGVSWRQASAFLARSLDLDGENISELLGLLKELECQLDVEKRKLDHAQQLINISRSTIIKRALVGDQ